MNKKKKVKITRVPKDIMMYSWSEPKRKFTERDYLTHSFLFIIPVLGQILWIISLVWYHFHGTDTFIEEVK
ncbi:MAG: hypothetical protein DRP42_04225 [Tenericutes bacterium]|nr:MAG: hypothetical protein DRP42_04225 [Mycoplasmatota bacterium]